MSVKCSDVSTSANDEVGPDDDVLYALPLTKGESYPLVTTPLPKAHVYSSPLPMPVVNANGFMNTPSVPQSEWPHPDEYCC